MPSETTIGVSSEAAELAQSMTTEDYHANSVFAELADESREVGEAIASIKTIQEKAGAAASNKEELAALVDACVSVTGQVLATYRRAKSGKICMGLLIERIMKVQNVIERCGFRRRVESMVKSAEDKGEISELQALLEKLPGEMDLAGILAREGATDRKGECRDTEGTTEHGVALLCKYGKLNYFMEEEEDEEPAERAKTPLLEPANVPEGAPALPGWHIERGGIMQDIYNGLCNVGSSRVLGLVGESGSGKTTAASEVVRRKELREFFHDGILWLTVNKGGKDRLAMLMQELALMVHEEVVHGTGRPPTSDNSTGFIRRLMERGRRGAGLRCLVVADNTWEAEVIAKLQETAMWVLITARDEKLVTDSGGEVVALGNFSEIDSLLLLREAAELRKEEPLPDAATELVELCGRLPMDLVSVGRWGTIRGNEDASAWSDAALTIRTELDGAQMDVGDDTTAERTSPEHRMAVLCAGLKILRTVNEQARWLYVSLAVLPDGHAFTVRDAAMLLNDGPFDSVDGQVNEEALAVILSTLDQWAIVTTAGRGPRREYRMHEVHSVAARYNLDHCADIRRLAVRNWVEHLSSLEVVKTTEVHVLMGLWRTVEQMRGEGWSSCRPYAIPLARMDASDPVFCRQSLEAVVDFHLAKGDPKAEYEFRQQLLEFERKTLGPAHPRALNTLTRLADCARATGETDAAQEWYRKAESTSFNVAFHMQDGFYQDEQEAIESLKALAWSMMQSEEWGRAEQILRKALDLQEVRLAPDSVKLANTLYRLGRCVREAGHVKGEAEEILLRAMDILQTKRKPDHWLATLTQEQLELCGRDAH